MVVVAADVEEVEGRALRRRQHPQVEGAGEAVVVLWGDIVGASPLDGGEEDAGGAALQAGSGVGGQRFGDGREGGEQVVWGFTHQLLDVLGGAGEAAHRRQGREDGLDEGRLSVQLPGDDGEGV